LHPERGHVWLGRHHNPSNANWAIVNLPFFAKQASKPSVSKLTWRHMGLVAWWMLAIFTHHPHNYFILLILLMAIIVLSIGAWYHFLEHLLVAFKQQQENRTWQHGLSGEFVWLKTGFLINIKFEIIYSNYQVYIKN
jgi:hypothetical protein